MNPIDGIVILGLDGKRILSQSCNDTINSKKFDRDLYGKTKSSKIKNEVLIVGNLLVVHRCVSELHMYVVGNRNENPAILDRVLCCLVEAVSTLISRDVQNQSIHGNLDQIALAIDQIYDQGVLLETDPDLVLERVCLKGGVSEQSMSQVLQNATEHLRFSWLRG